MARPSWGAKRLRTRKDFAGRSACGAPEPAAFLRAKRPRGAGPLCPAGKKVAGEGFGRRSASHRSLRHAGGDRPPANRRKTRPKAAARRHKVIPEATRASSGPPHPTDIDILPNRDKTAEIQPPPRLHPWRRDRPSWKRRGENSGRVYVRLSLAASEFGSRKPFVNLARAGHDGERAFALILQSVGLTLPGLRQSDPWEAFSRRQQVHTESESFDVGSAAPCKSRRENFSRARLVPTHHDETLLHAKERVGASAIYLVRSAQYQFCDCGVRSCSCKSILDLH